MRLHPKEIKQLLNSSTKRLTTRKLGNLPKAQNTTLLNNIYKDKSTHLKTLWGKRGQNTVPLAYMLTAQPKFHTLRHRLVWHVYSIFQRARSKKNTQVICFCYSGFLCIGVDEGCKTCDNFLSTVLAFLQKWRILNPFQSILTKVFISSSLIVKSNMSPFSKILSCLLDLGMVM